MKHKYGDTRQTLASGFLQQLAPLLLPLMWIIRGALLSIEPTDSKAHVYVAHPHVHFWSKLPCLCWILSQRSNPPAPKSFALNFLISHLCPPSPFGPAESVTNKYEPHLAVDKLLNNSQPLIERFSARARASQLSFKRLVGPTASLHVTGLAGNHVI